ncbi:MAG: phage terminase large subunit family protein, partial [Planctomycetota bacterium]
MKRFAARARGRRLRTRLQWAHDEVVLPEGPHKNKHFREHFQPYTGAMLRLMDHSPLRNFRFSGCVQSGKSFLGVICVLWHLFERGEDVGYAVPELDQSGSDKWQKEFLPVIQASPRLRRLLPDTGSGSQGGTPKSITFKNGATLRFISGTGGDHHRSNFTVPVVFMTEVDRYDKSGQSSRETSPPNQIINRTASFKGRAFTYEECTVTELDGRIWLELQESTNHKPYVKCCHCGLHVSPTREDFHGVDDAKTLDEAEANGCFRCSLCGEAWTDKQRWDMLAEMILVGEGQKLTIGSDGEGLLEGKLKATDRLGFSWNAYFNRFWSTKEIAKDEWNALYSRNPEDKDLERRQHAWTLPAEPSIFTLTPITLRDIVDRCSKADTLEKLPLG